MIYARGSIPAIRIHCITKQMREVEIQWVVMDYENPEYHTESPVFRIVDGGVTGYESFFLLGPAGIFNTNRKLGEGDFYLCAGTTGMWDTLFIRQSEMEDLVPKLIEALSVWEKSIERTANSSPRLCAINAQALDCRLPQAS